MAAASPAIIHGGDFNGHWLSKTDLVIKVTLTADGVDASIVAHNVGTEPEPVSIAWHPYFNLPSGDRKQVRWRFRPAPWPRSTTTTTSSRPARSFQ
jgi:galactose mutarotase-like enzyme